MNLFGMRTGPVLALALVGAAGCGGGDDSSGALSKSEYQKEGNAICKAALDKATDIPAPRSPDGVADYLEKLFALTDDANQDFKALDPPESLKKDHDLAVKSAEEGEAKLDAILDRVRQSDNPQTTVLREFKKLAPDLKEDIEISRRLGLEECLKTPGTSAPSETS